VDTLSLCVGLGSKDKPTLNVYQHLDLITSFRTTVTHTYILIDAVDAVLPLNATFCPERGPNVCICERGWWSGSQ